MGSPKVSVVLPAFNSGRFIGQSVESILNQTFTDFELIIVDDFSQDNTWTLIQEYAKRDSRIIAVRNDKNINLSMTLNKGIAIARGIYIARMDHDDISLPNRLEKQVNFLDDNLKVGIVGSNIEIMDEIGTNIGFRKYNLTDQAIRKKIFLYSPFCHPATVIRKTILNLAGNYKCEFNPAEDYELYFRIGMLAEFANLDEFLLRYRVVKVTSMTTGGTRRMEKKTIEVRYKYANLSPYRMNTTAYAYNVFHYLSLFLIPARLKIWVFFKLRNL
jgi:glycosyltransferase involved in cell wall biosynthesis